MSKHETEDFVGTCPCCFGEFKVRDDDNKNHRMVLHGFTRPGDGYAHGGCFGVDFAPFEYSTDGSLSYVNALNELLVRLETKLAAVQKEISDIEPSKLDEPIITITTHTYGGRTYEHKNETSLREQMELREREARNEVSHCRSTISYVSEMVAHWEKGTIVGYDSPITGKPRFLRRAPENWEIAKMLEHGFRNITQLDEYLKAEAKAEKDAMKATVIYVHRTCSVPSSPVLVRALTDEDRRANWMSVRDHERDQKADDEAFRVEFEAMKNNFRAVVAKSRRLPKLYASGADHEIHQGKLVVKCSFEELETLVANMNAKQFSYAKENGFVVTI
jgi:hypothetical protein